jgi:hypothetical protein
MRSKAVCSLQSFACEGFRIAGFKHLTAELLAEVNELRKLRTALQLTAPWQIFVPGVYLSDLRKFQSPTITITSIIMSASKQTAADNFTAIFNAASNEYKRVTGKSLDTHPFAAKLDTCHSPEAISNVFRTQARAISGIQKDNEKLMTWLEPMVYLLSTFSDTLGEGIALVCRLIHII